MIPEVQMAIRRGSDVLKELSCIFLVMHISSYLTANEKEMSEIVRT